jgi:hypothetical protein
MGRSIGRAVKANVEVFYSHFELVHTNYKKRTIQEPTKNNACFQYVQIERMMVKNSVVELFIHVFSMQSSCP